MIVDFIFIIVNYFNLSRLFIENCWLQVNIQFTKIDQILAGMAIKGAVVNKLSFTSADKLNWNVCKTYLTAYQLTVF